MTATQLDLFGPRARHNDPSTSHRAAARVTAGAPNRHKAILDLLGQRPQLALTKNEICERLRIDPIYWPTIASALSQLKNSGQLKWAGEEKRGTQNRWMLVEAVVETNGAL